MKVLRVLFAALDLVTVAGALEGISPGSARGLVLVVVAILGALVVFVAAVLTVAVLDQRKPPYSI
jgi:hypothetical protein